MSTNFYLVIVYGRHMCGGFLMTAISHVHLFFRCPSKIFLVYNCDILYHVFLFDICTYDVCQIFALMVVLKSCIKFGWLMYLVAHQKEFISGKLVNTCFVRCNHCKY